MLLMGLFFSVSSCDYLAVSDQMSGGLQNTDQIFENVAYTKRWYANVFAGIPDYSGINTEAVLLSAFTPVNVTLNQESFLNL